MYKTASQHQLRRIRKAGNQKRGVKFISPVAAEYKGELCKLSKELFGVEPGKLSRKMLRKITRAAKSGSLVIPNLPKKS